MCVCGDSFNGSGIHLVRLAGSDASYVSANRSLQLARGGIGRRPVIMIIFSVGKVFNIPVHSVVVACYSKIFD